jgi:transposase
LRVDKRLTTTRILREIRELGYDGGRTILGQHVRELRSQQGLEPARGVKRRFETGPGREMQVDWSPYLVSIAGCMVMAHALGCLLCASRKLFLRLYRDERQSTLLEALASAFEYFEGVAARLVLDNMATAVLGRFGPERQVLWHPRFLDFARHYGFEPFACRPRDPDRKGKKEKSFRLVYEDFIKVRTSSPGTSSMRAAGSGSTRRQGWATCACTAPPAGSSTRLGAKSAPS